MTRLQANPTGWQHADRGPHPRIPSFFFSNENEPPHIHVERAECAAKFWLAPLALASNVGFRSGELTELYRVIRENQVSFQERWDEYFRD